MHRRKREEGGFRNGGWSAKEPFLLLLLLLLLFFLLRCKGPISGGEREPTERNQREGATRGFTYEYFFLKNTLTDAILLAMLRYGGERLKQYNKIIVTLCASANPRWISYRITLSAAGAPSSSTEERSRRGWNEGKKKPLEIKNYFSVGKH